MQQFRQKVKWLLTEVVMTSETSKIQKVYVGWDITT